jgi:L-malate glycosyltransferase
MINIVFLIDRMWGANGGTEGQLLMLCNNLDKEKFKIHLFCLQNTPWLETSDYKSRITVLDVPRLLGWKALVAALRFRRYCRRNRIEIIQTYFHDSFIFGAIAGRLAGVRRIISCRRNLGPGFWRKNGLLFVFRIIKRLTWKYIANSAATKESIQQYEGIDPAKITVIYNGLDLSRFETVREKYRRDMRKQLNVGESDILIIMVSHLRKEKNIFLFINAAGRINRAFPQIRFLLLGAGPIEAEIREAVGKQGLQELFSLPGSVPDVVPYLAASDIACLTSDGESYSNAIIEYQAAGLPVTATAVGGNIEALRENGFLFPSGDLEKLAEILGRLIENKELRVQQGLKGRQEAFEKYSVSRMVREHEIIYEDAENPQ